MSEILSTKEETRPKMEFVPLDEVRLKSKCKDDDWYVDNEKWTSIWERSGVDWHVNLYKLKDSSKYSNTDSAEYKMVLFKFEKGGEIKRYGDYRVTNSNINRFMFGVVGNYINMLDNNIFSDEKSPLTREEAKEALYHLRA